jgi:hypothetical protein
MFPVFSIGIRLPSSDRGPKNPFSLIMVNEPSLVQLTESPISRWDAIGNYGLEAGWFSNPPPPSS